MAENDRINLVPIVADELLISRSEARRLINQGAVKADEGVDRFRLHRYLERSGIKAADEVDPPESFDRLTPEQARDLSRLRRCFRRKVPPGGGAAMRERAVSEKELRQAIALTVRDALEFTGEDERPDFKAIREALTILALPDPVTEQVEETTIRRLLEDGWHLAPAFDPPATPGRGG